MFCPLSQDSYVEKYFCGWHLWINVYFCSTNSVVSGLALRSLISVGFIFLYSIKKWSSFIFLQVAIQFSQHHLLKRLSLVFPHWICVAFIFLWVLWTFHPTVVWCNKSFSLITLICGESFFCCFWIFFLQILADILLWCLRCSFLFVCFS